MTTEARPDLEQRAREKADAIVAAWNERDHATSEKLSDRLTAVLLEHARELEALQRERDAYKKAKAENDERYMLERDTARRERDTALADLAAARAKLDGWEARARKAEGAIAFEQEMLRQADEALAAARAERDGARQARLRVLDREGWALRHIAAANRLLESCDAIVYPVKHEEAADWYAARDRWLADTEPPDACGRRCRYKHRGPDDCAGICRLAPIHSSDEPCDCGERP